MNPGKQDGGGAGRSAAPRLSAARLSAVQALYEMSLSGHAVDQVLVNFLRPRLDTGDEGAPRIEPDPNLFRELVRGISRRREELEEILSASLSEKWPLERLEVVLRHILCAGIYELLARQAVPARAVINEYVDLAHAFYGGAEPGMVNGILDRVARRLRPGELDPEAPNGDDP